MHTSGSSIIIITTTTTNAGEARPGSNNFHVIIHSRRSDFMNRWGRVVNYSGRRHKKYCLNRICTYSVSAFSSSTERKLSGGEGHRWGGRRQRRWRRGKVVDTNGFSRTDRTNDRQENSHNNYAGSLRRQFLPLLLLLL